MNLVAASAFGLESLVKWELQELGYEPRVLTPGRIGFEGDWRDVAKTNLWLRTADRVLIQLMQFEARDFDAIFDSIKAFDWRSWLTPDTCFPVTGRSRQSQLTSVPAIQRTAKKAIVDALRLQHQVEDLPESGVKFPLDIAILNDIATITLDTTGPSLHKRGYRTSYGEAPIKETLAAAMVMLSVWNPERPLLDPFCGSGTIPIEAAMLAKSIAPGSRRAFAWQHWPQTKGITTAEFVTNSPVQDLSLQISATDSDPNVLKLARRNAERAGVDADIHFQHKTFEELRSKRQYGCIITNPPYGDRLSDKRQLKPLYKSIPAVLQRLPTWSHFIITSMPRFEAMIQKSATRRRKLFNGRIECMYYQFLGPRPPKPKTSETETTRANPEREPSVVFGGLESKDYEQADLFATRLLKRSKHLRRWPTKQGITCFRLYERDIPELPFVVDRYETHYHITEYERPHDRDPGRHASWLDLMKKTVAKIFETPIQHVHLKSRQRQTGNDQHHRQSKAGQKRVVSEGGLKFLVNLSDYIDTGLFLDHRKTRQMVRQEATGKRFLNLFCYTGSFSVYAAGGNAQSTTSVDWSSNYLDWARENMLLNGFEGEHHRFVRTGTLEFLSQLKPSEKFDLVVVDPPTFSNSKRTENVWDVQRDHADLLNQLSRHVEIGGTVFFSTNFRKFKFVEEAVSGYEIREITNQTIPEDFRNKKIHRCWKLSRV